MNIIKSKKCLCACCMEEHEVKFVKRQENITFKDVKISFDAEYSYCDRADEYFENETQMQLNDIAMKDSYRQSQDLLTSKQIVKIRGKYNISQSDLSTLLGWGEKTITRYEGHQVQTAAHDKILRKLDSDPCWFAELLDKAKTSLSVEAYDKYFAGVSKLMRDDNDLYLRKTIESLYAPFYDRKNLTGNTALSINKLVDAIRYYASSSAVEYLFKVKLVKMLFYADFLSFKDRGHAITGLVYQAFPMGAVPVGHNHIILLKGVPCEEIEFDCNTAYSFKLKETSSYPYLSDDDKKYLDIVINKFGKMNKNQIVNYMHEEVAYKETDEYDYIDYKYAKYIAL